ncbi:MAG: hypothetical protein CMJ25_25765 [Phycisphaerae bacterium]|nr:hypothetical protein [Phycisphaerae bacterium]
MPILEKRFISDNLGALPVYTGSYKAPDPVKRDPTVENITTDEDGNETTTYTIPTYERTQVDIPADFDWTQYGRSGPALRFFNQIRTGEIEYDPSKDKIDVDALTETDPNAPPLSNEAEMIKQELISTATQLAAGVGAQIGRSVAANVTDDLTKNPKDGFNMQDISEGFDDFYNKFEGMDVIRAPKDGPAAKVEFSPDSPNAELAKKETQAEKDAYLATLKPSDTGYIAGVKDRFDTGLFDKSASAAGRANLYGSVGAGVATIAGNLIAGKSLKESVKTGAKVGAGTFVGTTIGGPIGGLIGGLLGGRVICNELMRQGIMTRKQVVLDYKFTEDYLTPQHVAGYHVWAVWMVRQMRKGRLVNFWKHVAGHRANEIAYIYGESDKPDYLGKVYRKILEPICWSIGFFCRKTDWTVLYKEKEV